MYWVEWVYWQDLLPCLYYPITTKEAGSEFARWQRLYPGYFGFISGQREEVETLRPSSDRWYFPRCRNISWINFIFLWTHTYLLFLPILLHFHHVDSFHQRLDLMLAVIYNLESLHYNLLVARPHYTQKWFPELIRHINTQQQQHSSTWCSPCGCVRVCRAVIWWTWCVLSGWCWGPRGSRLECSAGLPGCLLGRKIHQLVNIRSGERHNRGHLSKRRLCRSTGNSECCWSLSYYTLKQQRSLYFLKETVSSVYILWESRAYWEELDLHQSSSLSWCCLSGGSVWDMIVSSPEEDSSLSSLLTSQSKLLENWVQLFLLPRINAAAGQRESVREDVQSRETHPTPRKGRCSRP